MCSFKDNIKSSCFFAKKYYWYHDQSFSSVTPTTETPVQFAISVKLTGNNFTGFPPLVQVEMSKMFFFLSMSDHWSDPFIGSNPIPQTLLSHVGLLMEKNILSCIFLNICHIRFEHILCIFCIFYIFFNYRSWNISHL